MSTECYITRLRASEDWWRTMIVCACETTIYSHRRMHHDEHWANRNESVYIPIVAQWTYSSHLRISLPIRSLSSVFSNQQHSAGATLSIQASPVRCGLTALWTDVPTPRRQQRRSSQMSDWLDRHTGARRFTWLVCFPRTCNETNGRQATVELSFVIHDTTDHLRSQ